MLAEGAAVNCNDTLRHVGSRPCILDSRVPCTLLRTGSFGSACVEVVLAVVVWWCLTHADWPRASDLRTAAAGWDQKPGVRIVFGRWQDVLPQLGTYDGIFFDTCALIDRRQQCYGAGCIS